MSLLDIFFFFFLPCERALESVCDGLVTFKIKIKCSSTCRDIWLLLCSNWSRHMCSWGSWCGNLLSLSSIHRCNSLIPIWICIDPISLIMHRHICRWSSMFFILLLTFFCLLTTSLTTSLIVSWYSTYIALYNSSSFLKLSTLSNLPNAWFPFSSRPILHFF